MGRGASRVGLLLLWSLFGCEASLQDGVYGCAEGACPDGWVCGADQRCYREAPAAGAIGAAGSDLPGPRPTSPANDEQLGATCHPSSMPCEFFVCIFQPERDANAGVCVPRCSTANGCEAGAECAEVFEGDSHCLRSCGGTDDCDQGLVCGAFLDLTDVCIPIGWNGASSPLTAPRGMQMPPAP